MNRRVLLVPMIAVVAAVTVWKAAPMLASAPAATWRVGNDAAMRQGRNYDDLVADSPVRLAVTCDEPCRVYVFSHSDTDGTILLFPSPDLQSDLPGLLPKGSHVLPGKLDGKELAWTTRSGVLPVTTFVVVAAREPVPELEALLPRVRRWTNSVMTDRSLAVTQPKDVEIVGAPRQPLPAALLQRAAERSFTEDLVNGPLTPDAVLDGVWTGSWRVREKPAAKPAPAPAGK
ncbi:MAG: hypothetical protein JNN13_01745 [Planctomycetes bacterium]|nr:hypothetical protein [Planctomycetota bacterium]